MGGWSSYVDYVPHILGCWYHKGVSRAYYMYVYWCHKVMKGGLICLCKCLFRLVGTHKNRVSHMCIGIMWLGMPWYGSYDLTQYKIGHWHHIHGYESHIVFDGPHKCWILASYGSVWASYWWVLMEHIWLILWAYVMYEPHITGCWYYKEVYGLHNDGHHHGHGQTIKYRILPSNYVIGLLWMGVALMSSMTGAVL